MSTNIITWKTKKLENLVIPLSAFFIHPRKDWHPEQPIIRDVTTMEVLLKCGCGQMIKGRLIEGQLHVSSFKMEGEGSGGFKDWILDEALKQSTGELQVAIVWESGEVTNLTVKDGVLEENQVDL
jgi:hypothetical protein